MKSEMKKGDKVNESCTATCLPADWKPQILFYHSNTKVPGVSCGSLHLYHTETYGAGVAAFAEVRFQP
jgi:hypothetical protein